MIESTAGGGNSKCKGPKVRMVLVFCKNRERPKSSEWKERIGYEFGVIRGPDDIHIL